MSFVDDGSSGQPNASMTRSQSETQPNAAIVANESNDSTAMPTPTPSGGSDNFVDPFQALQLRNQKLAGDVAALKARCLSLTASLAAATQERDQARLQLVETSEIRYKLIELQVNDFNVKLTFHCISLSIVVRWI